MKGELRGMKTDIQIAQETEVKDIGEIAAVAVFLYLNDIRLLMLLFYYFLIR